MHQHRFDVVSFFFGVIFLGVGLTAVFGDEDVTALEARWIWPSLLVAAGLAIVVFSVLRGRKPDLDDSALESSMKDRTEDVEEVA